jgi:ribosomal protein L30E
MELPWHAENSEARLRKDVQYKLLVQPVNESTNEELGQLVSQSFSVSVCHLSLAIVVSQSFFFAVVVPYRVH